MTVRLRTVDSTLAFLREGYTFASSRCDALQTDLFRTRIAFKPVVFMRGAEAAEFFYAGGRFTRRGAMPPTVVHLLQDKGSVQTLDGGTHQHRKAMFLSLMDDASVDRLVGIFDHQWHEALQRWRIQGRIVLHDEVREVLTRSAAEWAGVPLDGSEAAARTKELGMMIDQAGSFGPANWLAQLRRRRTEQWMEQTVSGVRSGRLQPSEGSAAAVVARHRTPDGGELPAGVAAIELLNLVRPIVAVARFVVFAALALVEHPRWKSDFRVGRTEDLMPFAQEVRRYYPFFPVIGGRALAGGDFHGHRFSPGDWAMLDLYGTNHDGRSWPDPESFRPERFRGWQDNLFTLVPQGAGQVETGHRCPGEKITLELVMKATELLARSPVFEVPSQDTTIDLSSLPALPRSGMILALRSGRPVP